MEAKVKALKVAELRDALTKASIAFPAKANKTELVTKVLASPEALAALGLSTEPTKGADDNDDLLAPPAEFDWNGDAAADKPSSTAKPAAKAAATAKDAEPKATPAASVAATPLVTRAQPTVPDSSSIDPELEKRRKRAERFGIPLLEPKTPSTPTPASAGAAGKRTKALGDKTPTATPAESADKLNARAARFGIPVAKPATSPSGAAVAGNKRKSDAVATPADPEEEERRKKRAARFGAPVAATS